MTENHQTPVVLALNLEIEELEQFCNPGCNSSSTSRGCTCPVTASTAGSLFTSKATS